MRSVLGGEMQVKPQAKTLLKSAFFLLCSFDIIQNFKQARNKYPADIAKIGYTAGATHKPLRKEEPAIQAEHQQKA